MQPKLWLHEEGTHSCGGFGGPGERFPPTFSLYTRGKPEWASPAAARVRYILLSPILCLIQQTHGSFG